MKLLFATTNPGKIISPQRHLARYGIEVVQASFEIPELQDETSEGIARQKAAYAFGKLGEPVIVMDTGFYIPSLGGFPGPNAKLVTKQIGCPGYMRLLASPAAPPAVSEAEPLSRDCYFEDAFAFMDDGLSEAQTFLRRTPGTLATAARGDNMHQAMSDLWRIFMPQGTGKTLASMTPGEVTAFRDRPENGLFFRDLAGWLLAHHASKNPM
jgi:XTP/dITP diphosphohydrolase